MKKLFVFVSILIMICSTNVYSEVVNFDDLPETYHLYGSNYAGITWGYSHLSGDIYGGFSKPPYDYSIPHSYPNYVSNGYGVNNLSFTFSNKVNFQGAWFAKTATSDPDTKVRFIDNHGNHSDWLTLGSTPQYLSADFKSSKTIYVERTATKDIYGVGAKSNWYSMDDVTYANRGTTYGIFLGYNSDPYHLGVDTVTAVKNKMVTDGILTNKNTVLLTGENDSGATLANAIAGFNLSKGDTLYIYNYGHGGIIRSSNGETTSTVQDEQINVGKNNYISDDEMTYILKNLGDIQKYVFLDSCNSGGFWGNRAEEVNSFYQTSGDLERLSNIALFAASSETGLAYSNLSTGMGYMSEAVLQGLTYKNGHLAADYDKDGSISFDEWDKYLNSKDWWPLTFNTKAYENGGEGDLVDFNPGMLAFNLHKSNDFNGITDYDSVPEPTTMLLLGLGLMGLAGARRKLKK
jgi:hypothetical protein